MNDEIYSIVVKGDETITYNGAKHIIITPIGSVKYNEFYRKLILETNITKEIEFNNITEVLEYTKENDWLLYDMQGALYDSNVHMLLTEDMSKVGIGYIIR